MPHCTRSSLLAGSAALALVLAACDSAPVSAPEAREPDVATVQPPDGGPQQARLEKAGRPGLRLGVNFSPPSRQSLEEVRKHMPQGHRITADKTRFEPRGVRLSGDVSSERLEAARTKGGSGFVERRAQSAGGAPAGGGRGGPLATIDESGGSWSYYGLSDAYAWFWGDYVDFYSATGASKNISYIDVIADSYVDFYPYTTLYNYAYDAAGVSTWWTYYAYWYGYYNWYSQYGDHYVYDSGYWYPDGYYWDNFFTADYEYVWY